MSKRLSVLISSTARYPFVQEDIETLGKHFEVDVYIGSGLRGVWENFRRGARADVSFSWFGSVYTFFMILGSKLGRRRSMVMLGGVDVANEPAMRYGIWRSGWKGLLLGYALDIADKVYAVDMSLRQTLERSSGRRWEKIEALPTGYDASLWTPQGAKEDFVLCIATCNSLDRAVVKGLDLLIEGARRLSDVEFHAIGIEPSVIAELAADAPANIHLHPPVPRADLLDYYRRARVYCQPSRREGLPNALCEAMLCGCIAAGAKVGGIPTAIDDCGFLFEKGSVDGLCDAITRALEAPESLGMRGRNHIIESFAKERREKILVRTINQLGGAEAIH